MTKYLHKAFEELEPNGSKRYWASKSNDKVEPERVWLAACSFIDGIKETYALASIRLDGQWMNQWCLKAGMWFGRRARHLLTTSSICRGTPNAYAI